MRLDRDPIRPFSTDGLDTEAVAVAGIDKAFGGVPVLRGVTLELAAGSILGLVGENGAGKSTLMNILGGSVQPDAGSMRVGGRPFAPRTPADARSGGIAFVHQELTLFGNLTIAENLHLTRFPRRYGLPWIDRRASIRDASDLLARVGLPLQADMLVEALTAGERQLVEIARALGTDARVLILDEPTTSLGATERRRLLDLVRELREAGMAIIFISHELSEVLQICDRVAVLRDGEVVAAGRSSQFPVERLLRVMVGREVRQLYPARRAPRADPAPLLEVRGLHEPSVAHDISLTLHRGEVLGLFGLMGAGRSELARMLFGLDRHAAGSVLLEGRPLTGGPARRIRRGLAFVTEDRRQDGLCLEAPVADNIALVHLSRLTRTPLRLIDERALRAEVARTSADVQLSGRARPDLPAGRLSGGNQQKVVLAKWLMGQPRVLILDEPTRGIDVAARGEIYALIQRLADCGMGVLVISSDLEELTGICDRVVVMRQGEIGGEFPADRLVREDLLRAALPARVSG